MPDGISRVVPPHSGAAAQHFQASRVALRGIAFAAPLRARLGGFPRHDPLRLKAGERDPSSAIRRSPAPPPTRAQSLLGNADLH